MARSVPVASRPNRRRGATGELKAEAYKVIRDRILMGEYLPASALSEYGIAASLAVSRTPVREALKQLEQEGLIRSIPQKGVFVTALTVSDIDEIYQVREQLESLAARIAAVEMDADDIAELSAELRRATEAAEEGRADDAFDADVHLHKKIIAATRNGRLEHILSTLDDQVHRIRYLSPRTPGRLRATLAEHMRIIDCLESRDADAAADAMADHLRNARDNAIRLTRPPEVRAFRR
jgi:DNA-binding GntR family transcriptional regulator